ncbi:conjugal transfer protein [Cedecea sp. P7760]|uniref:helix-turn-helix transcriptional regulator n=1 Tax=Cedecea sp. P7760 TaxID=2726983 RepID=UPI0015A1382E|nr:conjugal transfer protein [Cedecea sp. P7760]NWC64010.1 conjugal transfer protein [Cedecea sp. P7760]
MAAVDPIVYSKLCKLFPELTQLQITDTCLYSAGATYKESGELRGVSPETIKKSLEAARRRLDINNLQSLRLIFLSRVVLNCNTNSSCLGKNSFALSNSNLSELDHFITLVPELSFYQAKCVFYFVNGLTAHTTAEKLESTADEIMIILGAALNKLQVYSLNALRVLIFSKLLVNLALVSC